MADADVVRRITNEAFMSGNVDVIDDLVADDYVDNDPLPGLEGKAGMKQLATMVVGAFSDRKMLKDDLYETGDVVVEDWAMTGRHTGEFLGVKPQGNEVTVRGIDIWRIRDGKVIEHSGVADMLTAFSQMGGFPEF